MVAMKQASINLSDGMAEFINSSLEAGRFHDLDELVAEGITLVKQREEASLKEFLDSVEEGENDIRDGRYDKVTNLHDHKKLMAAILKDSKKLDD